MGVKVCVAGGGSTYTPELVEGLVDQADRVRVDELVLLDARRGTARRRQRPGGPVLAGRGGAAASCSRRAATLRSGADFVIAQLRVGGQAARLTDEMITVRFGSMGQGIQAREGSRRLCARFP